MQLASSARIPDGLLAAMRLGGEKPHQGLPSRNPALYQGPTVCNSTTALGLQAAAVLNRVGSCSTQKERDAETGNDYFFARYYGAPLGRFISPDWSAKASPVPYATFGDPQSLNLYAYVRNNPLSRTDVDGHTCKSGDWGCNAWNTAAQNWSQLHGIVNQSVQKVQKVAAEHPRTMKALKGTAKVVGGIAAVGVSATSEVGSGGLATVPVIFGVMGGVSMFVGGVTDIAGAATDTDTSEADKGLAATSNPAALLTTVATGGNLRAGATAGAIGDALVTGVTLGDVAKGSRLAVGTKAVLAGQSLSEGAQAVHETIKPDDK